MPIAFILIMVFFESAHSLQFSLPTLTTFCPVASSLSNGFYTYPVDLFDSEQNKIKRQYLNRTFDCFAYDAGNKYPNNMTQHICSHTTTLCPLDMKVVGKTLEGTKLKRNVSSMCKITEVIVKDISKLNIFVVGGSVTLGTFAAGCKTKDSCISQTKESFPQLRACPSCAWPNYLNMMIHKVFGKKLRDVVNLARNGRSSIEMSEQILSALRANKIDKLSGNDLFFIDHSTNDNTFSTPLRSKQLAVGLETLIRKIYTFSDPKSLPTIILLATEHVPRHLIKHPSLYYTNIYNVISDHYRIPLWNMDDLYRSHLLNSNISFTKYITRQYNWDEKHPSWMVHLYTADLIGAIMLQELEECNKMSATDRLQLIKKHYLNNIAQLPPPLYNHTDSGQCGTDTLLSMSYDNLVVKEEKTLNGSWASKPLNAWQLRLDANGRTGGFIHEFNYTGNNTQNETAGDGAELIFTLPLTKKEFNTGSQNILLKLTILRTYENAGYVQVLFCNRIVIFPGLQIPKIGGLDALWNDFESYRYSLPETFSALLTTCPANNGGNVTIVLNHTRRDDFVKARQHQKFKLMNIELCYADINM